MIDQTLATSLRDKSTYTKSSGSIAGLIIDTVDDTIPHKKLKDKQLNTAFPEKSIGNFDFNELDIKRVVQNLIINAGYASKKGGKIEVTVSIQNNEALVQVTDHGTGIPDDVKPLLMKEKYTSKPDGNGFGLLSCKEIIEKYHQGKFGFESEWGKGSTFYFTLPM